MSFKVLITLHRRTIEDVRHAIPARLFKRDTARGLTYLARDIVMATFAWKLATYIDVVPTQAVVKNHLGGIGAQALRMGLWLT